MESLSQKETRSTKSENNAAKRIVGVIFGIIEIILAFRLIFKLLGANSQNGFVKAIYNLTQFFIGIFEGIFAKITTGDKAVFEPATFIAMIIVALAAWIILKLMTPRQNSRVERIETTSSNTKPATQPLQQYPTQQQVPPSTQQPPLPTDQTTDKNQPKNDL